MADQQLDNLKIAEVASLTNKQVDEFKELVEEKDATENDLEQLIEAEKAGKDREEVIEYLQGMINKQNVSEKLDTALENLSDLEETIGEVDQLENTGDLDEKDEVELDQSQIIELIEGTVDELKQYVEDNFLYRRQLEEILEAEEAGKNRKTAKRFLNKKIENKGIEEEIKESKEDLQRLKKDIENLSDHFEELGDDFEYSDTDQRDEKSQEAANELLEITNSIIQDLKQSDNIKNREELEKKTNEVIQALQNDNYGKVRDALVAIRQMGYDTDGEDTQEKMEQQDEKLERMKQIVDDIQESEEDIEEEMEEQSHGPNFDKKKQIAGELNTDFSDEDLEEVTLQELQELKREQKHREELIQKLMQRGLDEDDLRDSSTSDLEKLLQTSDSMDDRTERFEDKGEDEEPEKSNEEIRQEAEEDLENLQGAVSSQPQPQEQEEEEDEGPSATERLGGFTEQIKNRIGPSQEESGEGMNENKVRELLEDYRDIENDQEASVKIAHVMKSYLESKLNVQREMTYRELAERIPTDENEEMRQLSNFFQKMHKQEYTDSIQIDDIEEVIDNCEAVLQKMR